MKNWFFQIEDTHTPLHLDEDVACDFRNSCFVLISDT